MVTVGITTYNRAALLSKAIASVLAQSYRNLELLVVDDNSSDDTQAVVSLYQDPRICYCRSDTNRGLAFCRNLATQRARGNYIAFLDDDDTWEVAKIAMQVQLAEQLSPEFAVVYCGCLAVTDDHTVINEVKPIIRGRIRDVVASGRLSTVPSASLFRTDALRRIGGHDAALRSHVDHDIWMQMSRYDYSADFVDAPLVRARTHVGYRLTADVAGRWNATDQYFEKWRPFLREWMGPKRADSYERTYMARVMSGVARESITRGDLPGLCRSLASVVSRWPRGISTRAVVYMFWRTVAGAALDRFRILCGRSRIKNLRTTPRPP